MQPYIDRGATAFDDVDGTVKVTVTGLAAVDTSVATPEGQPGYMLTYSAKDAAGNEAIALFREVRVVDPCAPEQVMCPELEMCSVLNRTCNEDMVTLFSNGDAGPPAPKPYVPEPDTAPPVLKLRGVCEEPSCRPATTSNGMSVYVHTVTVGDGFTDPGATASDEVDGNLTQGIAVVFSPGRIQTVSPTLPDAPYSIIYRVSDLAGNIAAEVARQVHVTCPAGEQMCPPGEEGEPLACASEPSLCAFAGFATKQSGNANTDAKPPQLALIGPQTVRITAGEPYGRCSPQTPPGVTCERGASAVDEVDGDLAVHLEVCPVPESQQPNLFSKSGLTLCDLDTTAVGTHNITFQVWNMAEPPRMASAVRTIVVLPKCTVIGEFICQDEISCSMDRVCLGDDVTSDSGGGSEEDPSVQALTLTLIGPSTMRVKQMQPFESCQAGQDPTEDVPCDPGVAAIDSSGADLSATALALPAGIRPEDCLTTDCTAYRIGAKGLQGCGIDTTNAVGTLYTLRYAVVSHISKLATVNRTIEVSRPCPVGEELCSEDKTCSEDCSLRYLVGGSMGGEDPVERRRLLLEQVADSLPDAGQAYVEEESSGGTATAAGGESELQSNSPVTAELQIAALKTQVQQLANMAADSTASLDVVGASLSSAFGTGSGAGGSQVATSSLVSSLLLDAQQYHDVVEEGGLRVLEAADQALQRQASLLQSLKDTIVDFQDTNAASMEMLTTLLGHTVAFMDVFSAVQQDAAEGTYCITTDQSGSFRGEFTVTHQGGELVPGSRRSLLIAGGTSSSGKGSRTKDDFEKEASGDEEAAVRAAANALNSDSWDVLKGHVSGSGFSRIQSPFQTKGGMSNLHGGLLVHVERKAPNVQCGSKHAHLSSYCTYAATLSEEAMQHLQNPLSPFGIDPLWAAGHSLSDLRPNLFWNTSDGSDEIFQSSPHAFFPRPMAGHADGFPVWFPRDIEASRVNLQFAYLLAGGYLGSLISRPDAMVLEGVVLYPGLNTLAHVITTFRWLAGGNIAATSQAEVVTRLNVGMQRVFLVIGTLLPLAYGCFVVWSISRLYKSRRGRQKKEIAMAVVDLVSLTGMWVAMYLNYAAIGESSRVRLQKDYNVYNSLADADVRLLLPQKVSALYIKSTTQTLDSGNSTGNGTDADDILQLDGPGSALLDSDALGPGSGKWHLQDNNTDLDRIGLNHVHIATVISYKAASGVIASYCILMMMLVALIKLSMINFRLGITVQAFISSISDLAHFILILIAITAMVAVMSSLLFAEYIKELGSMGEAMAWTWKVALLMDTGGLTLAYDRDEGLDLSITEGLSVRVWMYTIRPITLVLIMMLSGIYIDAFCSEAADKRENFPSVADDLVDLVGDIFNYNDMQLILKGVDEMEERLYQERLRDEEKMKGAAKFARRMVSGIASFRERTTLSKDLEITAQEACGWYFDEDQLCRMLAFARDWAKKHPKQKERGLVAPVLHSLATITMRSTTSRKESTLAGIRKTSSQESFRASSQVISLEGDSTFHDQDTTSFMMQTERVRSQFLRPSFKELPHDREIAQALLSRSNQEMYGVRTFEFEEHDATVMARKETIKLTAQINQVLAKLEEAASAMMGAMELQIQELDAMQNTILPVLEKHEAQLRADLIDTRSSLPGTPSERRS